MTEVTNHLYDTIDEQNSGLPASTRRGLVKTTAAALGSMGMLGLVADNAFGQVKTADRELGGQHHHRGRHGRGAGDDRQHRRRREARRPARRDHAAQRPRGGAAGEEPLRAADLQRRRRQGRDDLDPRPGRGLLEPDRAAHHARRRRPGVHQRLPAGEHRVRAPGNAEGLEVRPLHGGDHGRRGRPPRARAAVAGQARQRPRVREVRPARGHIRPADHGHARLLQDHGRRRDPRVRGLRLRQGRAASRDRSTSTPPSPRARRPTRT